MKLVTLETPRLILKGFSPEDMNYIFSTLNKAEVMQLLGHRNEEDFLKEREKQQKGYATYNRSFLLFLLHDKETGKIIGRCGIHNWNPDHFRAEIGYNMIEENLKRKGFMSEAIEAIIAYGFRELNLNRIEALVAPGNVPSIRLLQKNNFIQEAVLKQHYLHEGKYEDSLMFALLREDYYNEVLEFY